MTIAEIEKYVSPKVVERDNGCWDWTATTSTGDYPVATAYVDGVYRFGTKVSRAVCAAFNGPTPEGYEVDHVCRNRLCLRIDHLEAVTRAENTRRKMIHGRAVHLAEKGHELDAIPLTTSGGCRTCHRTKSKEYQRLKRLAKKGLGKPNVG